MLVERIYENVPKRPPPRPRNNFRASEAGDCRRQIAYARLGTTQDPLPPQKLLLFQDGHTHQREVSELIRQLKGIKLQGVEKEFKKKVTVGSVAFVVIGHADGIVVEEAEGEMILEVKGVNHFTFEDFKKTREVKQAYIDQALMYMWMSDIPKALILVKNKNTSELLEFPLEYDPERVKILLKRYADVESALQQKKLPARDFELGSKECYQCDYFSSCHGAKVKRIIRARRGAKGDPKVVEVDATEPNGKTFFKLTKAYYTLKNAVSEDSAKVEQLRELLLLELKQMKADGAQVERYSLLRKTSFRRVPDKGVVSRMIKQGLIPVKETAYDQLEVDWE
jgi:hypothetical protein